jgi:hypothetical protein
MKKLLTLLVCFAALRAVSYAETDKTDIAALNILKVSAKSGCAEWTKKNDYYKKCLMFNGHQITVYFIAECSLQGLSYRMNVNDLPADIVDRIKNRYPNYIIADALLFIDSNGNIKYYAGIKSKKRYTALRISPACNMCVIKSIPLHKNLS